MGREDEIRIIAYRIWEEESCCHGRDAEHWLKAEVIWEEKQRDKEIPGGTKTKSVKTAKRVTRDRTSSKKR